MRRAAWLLLVGLTVAGCDPAGAPAVEPSPTASTEATPEAGPCPLNDDEAPCVVWRRSGFVAASSSGQVVVAAEADGIVKGLDAESGDVLWETEMDGEVAAIATVEDRAYVSMQDVIVALDVAEGRQMWQHAGSLVHPGRGDTPAILAGEGVVYGVATDDGQDLWSADALSGFVGNAIGDELVVISLESEVVAIDRTTGQKRWRYASELPIFASVVTAEAVVASTASSGSEFDGYVILDADDGRLVNGRDDVRGALVIEAEGHLVEVRFGQGASGIDATTGEYTWDIPLGNAFFVGGRAFTLRDRALVMTADQEGVEVVALIDPATGQQRWQVRADAQLAQVQNGSRFLAIIRLGGITLHDPATGEGALVLAVTNGIVLGDDPLAVYDGDAITGVRVP